jgi:hypothetical protein
MYMIPKTSGASDRCFVHYGSDRSDISRRTLQTRGSTDLSRRRLDVDRCLGNGGRQTSRRFARDVRSRRSADVFLAAFDVMSGARNFRGY